MSPTRKRYRFVPGVGFGASAVVAVAPVVVDPWLVGVSVTLGAAMVAGRNVGAVVGCAGLSAAWAGAGALCVTGVPADGAGALVC